MIKILLIMGWLALVTATWLYARVPTVELTDKATVTAQFHWYSAREVNFVLTDKSTGETQAGRMTRYAGETARTATVVVVDKDTSTVAAPFLLNLPFVYYPYGVTNHPGDR